MSTCKDCIHYEVCNRKWVDDNGVMKMRDSKECYFFKDRSKFIELPCKVGDTVYRIIRNDITEWRVDAINYRISECSYEINGCFLINLTHKKTGYNNSYYLYKEDIYFSKKEAEQALKERDDNE